MGDYEKQSLNKGYYGPAIPPPARSYHSHRRGSGCGCCCCLFGLLFKIILTIVIIVAVAGFLFWLIVRPNKLKYHVVEASLTDFNLTTNNTLHYNLNLNMTIRNPNRRIGVYYDRIEARAYYEDVMLNSVTFDPFYQGHKKTNIIYPAFNGTTSVQLGASEISEFNTDKTSGIYDIDVKLHLRVRFKLGAFKTGRWKPKIACDLKVPLTSDGRSSGTFETTRCDFDF